ncbi:MAG: type II toxin-antitoxin system VapC family toxin [Bacillota bacterium]|nr:type II toxin-antitoxin system VapC family toxin [Bacillota bacterium]
MTVCVDASLVMKFLTYEPDADVANAWLQVHKDKEMMAPWFLPAEVASVLRRKMLRGEITDQEGQEALLLLDSLDFTLASDFALVRRAFDLAVELDQPSVYDTLYLAVAERERCDLWTADARFAQAACSRYSSVRLIGSLQSLTTD